MVRRVLSFISDAKGAHSEPTLNSTTVPISNSVAMLTRRTTSTQPKEWLHSAACRASCPHGPVRHHEVAAQLIRARSSIRGATNARTQKSTAKKISVLSSRSWPVTSMSWVIEITDISRCWSVAGRMRFPRKPPRSTRRAGMQAPTIRVTVAPTATSPRVMLIQMGMSSCPASLSLASSASSGRPSSPLMSPSLGTSSTGASSCAAQCVRSVDHVIATIRATAPHFSCMKR
mmetsp:Transcript_47299/g.134944  ORF Transcript_47299/g.134944 Transcript_47299/m.134944 type:complete len:231 (-) Transcript_47299:180-872(-)